MCTERKFQVDKGSLKNWHQQHTKNSKGRVNVVKERLSVFDMKREEQALMEEELEEFH